MKKNNINKKEVHNQKLKPRKVFLQVTTSILALVLIGTGVLLIVEGRVFYNNYWGGMVYAPAAILVGVLLMYVVIFKWDDINKIRKE